MLSCAVRGTVDLGGFLPPSLFFFRNGIMGVISLHKQCIVIAGLVRTHLRANKARLKVVPQDLFSRLTVLLIHTLGMMAVMLPAFFLGMYQKNGLPAEKLLMYYVQAKFIRPKIRPYQTSNYYSLLMKGGMPDDSVSEKE